MEVMQAPDLPDVSALLQRVGMTLLNSVGGAMGPLFGVAFIRAGQAAAGWEIIDGNLVAAMLEAARDGVMARGKARSGDKTMVDALAPAAEAARQAADAGADGLAVLSAASDAATRGAVATREMLARMGRASRLGERSRGHQDAGATSVAVMLAAARGALDPTSAPGAVALPSEIGAGLASS